MTGQKWRALAEAGWQLDGEAEATKDFETLGLAIGEWERVTGLDSTYLGTVSDAAPHLFIWSNGPKSGAWRAQCPTHGYRYEGQ